MDERMWEASEAGNIDALYALIQENPFVLESIDKFPFVDTPLHRAGSEGHIDFVMEMMNLKPSFARKLNPSGFSPMHLALQNDRNMVVNELLKVDKDLVRVKGRGGLTPLHLAVEQGNLDLVAEFLEACPECITDVTIQGHTALHIAAIQSNFEALQLLIGWLQKNTHKDGDIWEEQVLNRKDRAGNTVLHMAASINNLQIVELLAKCKKMKNSINVNDQTPLEMLESHVNVRATASSLHWPGRFKGQPKLARQTLAQSLRKKTTCLEKLQSSLARQNNKISNDMRNTMLVVAALILTASYQACLSPPGGIWQGDSESNTTYGNSKVGLAVLGPYDFGLTYAINSATFLTSTCIVFFLLPDESINPLKLPILLLILCYTNSVYMISPLVPYFTLFVGGLLSFLFVSWPKMLDLYYRKRVASWRPFFGVHVFILVIIFFITFGLYVMDKFITPTRNIFN